MGPITHTHTHTVVVKGMTSWNLLVFLQLLYRVENVRETHREKGGGAKGGVGVVHPAMQIKGGALRGNGSQCGLLTGPL